MRKTIDENDQSSCPNCYFRNLSCLIKLLWKIYIYVLFVTIFFFPLHSNPLSLCPLSPTNFPSFEKKIFFTLQWWWRRVISRLVAYIMTSPVCQDNRTHPTKPGSFTPSYSVTDIPIFLPRSVYLGLCFEIGVLGTNMTAIIPCAKAIAANFILSHIPSFPLICPYLARSIFYFIFWFLINNLWFMFALPAMLKEVLSISPYTQLHEANYSSGQKNLTTKTRVGRTSHEKSFDLIISLIALWGRNSSNTPLPFLCFH